MRERASPHAYEVSCRVRTRFSPACASAGFTPRSPHGPRKRWVPRSCPVCGARPSDVQRVDVCLGVGRTRRSTSAPLHSVVGIRKVTTPRYQRQARSGASACSVSFCAPSSGVTPSAPWAALRTSSCTPPGYSDLVRPGLSSASLTPRLGRARLVLLGLLSLLGLLAMHGTPAMAAMPHSVTSPAHPIPASAPENVMGAAMDSALSTAAMAGSGDRTTPVVRDAGHGQHLPPAHMTAPCVSDMARAAAHAPASTVTAASPMPARAVGHITADRAAADIERAPPDLLELCISRT